MQNHNEQPALHVTEDTPLQMPVKVFILVGVALSSSILAWATVRADIKAAEREINVNATRLYSLESKFEQQREILAEIRADVKSLNRANQNGR
jgi:hypothetical protein